MLVRNAFVFTCDCAQSPEQLAEVLAGRRYSGIGELDAEQIGWVNPKEIEGGPLVHVVDSLTLIAVQKETKIIPASMVKKRLIATTAEIEQREGRSLSRKERTEIRKQVYESLLPAAPTRTKLTFGVLHRSRRQLIVLTTSQKCVDEFLGLFADSCMKRNLRPSFGKLRTITPPHLKMTDWLANKVCDEGFELGVDCELAHEKSKVRYTLLELDRPEIRDHLQEGKVPVKLGLRHHSTTTFVLACDGADSDLVFSKIDYGENEGKPDSDASPDEVFDSDLLFSVSEFLEIANELFQVFGGIAPDAVTFLDGATDAIE